MYYEKHILSGSQSIKNKSHDYRIKRVEIFFLGNNHHNSNGNDNIVLNDDVYDWMNNLKKMMMKKRNQKSVKTLMTVLNEKTLENVLSEENSYICIS